MINQINSIIPEASFQNNNKLELEKYILDNDFSKMAGLIVKDPRLATLACDRFKWKPELFSLGFALKKLEGNKVIETYFPESVKNILLAEKDQPYYIFSSERGQTLFEFEANHQNIFCDVSHQSPLMLEWDNDCFYIKNSKGQYLGVSNEMGSDHLRKVSLGEEGKKTGWHLQLTVGGFHLKCVGYEEHLQLIKKVGLDVPMTQRLLHTEFATPWMFQPISV